MRRLAWVLGGLSVVGAARAEIADVRLTGFEVRQTAEIAAPAATVWAALAKPGAWWDPEHTFSGQAGNLSIALEPGGCWCEKLAGQGAGVEHMRVVYVKPPIVIRLEGALGPLQTTGATGHMAWALKETAGRTNLTLTYDVGGYAKGGFAGWAKPVDKVLGEQLQRLKWYVESGKP